MKIKILFIVMLISVVFLTGQSCRYADYISEQLIEGETVDGEVCIQLGDDVLCGSQSEIAALGEIPEVIPEEPEIIQPENSDILTREFIEMDLVNFPSLAATDPDGDQISYNFTPPLNKEGEWKTEEGDAGDYIVTIFASDGKATIFQDIKLIIHKFNHPPTLEYVNAIRVAETDTISLNPIYSDVDAQDLSIKYDGFMTNGEYTTTYDDAGNHITVITVSDGEKTATQDVEIIVENVNRVPVLELIENIEAIEKDNIQLSPKANDPDGESLLYTYSALFNTDGQWRTQVGDHGSYEVIVTVSDGDLSASQSVPIYVEYWDKPPIFEKLEDIIVDETDTVVIRALAFDPEGKEIVFTYEGWMNSDTKETNYDDSGVYDVTVKVSDGFNELTQDIRISVNNVNRPPIFRDGSFN